MSFLSAFSPGAGATATASALTAPNTAVPSPHGLTASSMTLGSIAFTGTEIPEKLYPVGGTQTLAIHEFPGGVRTIQSLGAFPPRSIGWSGLLAGPTAFTRSFAIDRLRVAGAAIHLTYGAFRWKGVVSEYSATIHNEWIVRYHIEFVPAVDESTPPVPPSVSPNVSALHASLAGLGSNIPVTENGVSLPYGLSNPLQSLYNVGVSALLNSGNNIGALSASDLSDANNYAIAAFAAGSGIISSSSTSASSTQLAASALHVLSFAGIAQALMNQVAPTSRIVTINNPNLYSLAAQYLGDASRWTVIAQMNGLTDPMPLGTYTLNIPSASGLAPVPTPRFA